jgi:hypothetical protein
MNYVARGGVTTHLFGICTRPPTQLISAVSNERFRRASSKERTPYEPD